MEKTFSLTTAVAIQVFTKHLISPSPLSTHHRINQDDDDLTLHPLPSDIPPCTC